MSDKEITVEEFLVQLHERLRRIEKVVFEEEENTTEADRQYLAYRERVRARRGESE